MPYHTILYYTISYYTVYTRSLYARVPRDPNRSEKEPGRRCNARAHGASAAQRSFPLLDAARSVDFRVAHLVVHVSCLCVCNCDTCFFSLSLSLSVSRPASFYTTLHALSPKLVIKRLLCRIGSAAEVWLSIGAKEPLFFFLVFDLG